MWNKSQIVPAEGKGGGGTIAGIEEAGDDSGGVYDEGSDGERGDDGKDTREEDKGEEGEGRREGRFSSH